MTQTPKRGLGRGFESLLPADFDKSLLLTPEDRIEKIPVKALTPNPHQPRKHFDNTALQELAASIKRHGVVQPLVVTPAKNGHYVLIAGERRWRASQLAGLQTIPAIIRDTKELEQLEVALIENVQRVDLSPLEQAVSIERLHQQFSLSYDVIAQRLGKASSTISNTVRLLQLPEAARDALASGKITEGHARAILALKGDAERQVYLLKTIISQGWSVRQAERFAVSVKQGVKQTKQAHARTETETPATKSLSKKLGAPVTIRRTAKGGKLEITFTTDDELARLLGLFDR
ncbi:MAG TPA: ParB/RepB/Spo0J family partition protein [Verrucomicrobiae bacterium]|jgi:ParB family chromosome partitioning protein|nr:ParB/RepB/Spo0J family partition protein [Verrucomicrobiae bacterium]